MRFKSGGATASYRPADRLMNRAAMQDDILVGDDELLQRRIDIVEIDVGDEAVDGGIDAGRLPAMDITLRGDQRGEGAEIGKAARHGGIGIEAADALVVVALMVERLGLGEAVLGQVPMLPLERSLEHRPEAPVLP